jgi:hypothetical protein
VTKARRMKWMKKVARMKTMRYAKIIFVRKPEGRGPLGNLEIDGRIMLKLTLKKLL